MCKVRVVFLQISRICKSKERWLSMFMLRFFIAETWDRALLLKVWLAGVMFRGSLSILMYSHLDTLKLICQVSVHTERLLRSDRRFTESTRDLICWYAKDSSAKSFILQKFTQEGMSLMYIKKGEDRACCPVEPQKWPCVVRTWRCLQWPKMFYRKTNQISTCRLICGSQSTQVLWHVTQRRKRSPVPLDWQEYSGHRNLSSPK